MFNTPVWPRIIQSTGIGKRRATLLSMRAESVIWPDLVAVRAKKGISLEAISGQTKIGTHYLEAIEAGSIERLPGGIYSRSYLRQYARLIDFNEDELVDLYDQAVGVDPESTMPAPPPRRTLTDLLRATGVLGLVGYR